MYLTIHILLVFTVVITFCYNENVDEGIVVDNINQFELSTFTPIEIAAVGRVAKLGELYDARSDQFLHVSLFKSKISNTSITSTQNRETKLQYTLLNSYEEKFRTLDISAELKLSILGGLFELKGSGRYFKDAKRSARTAKASLIYSLSTEYEGISITEANLKPLVDLDVLEQIDATHVVVSIQWGGRVFISVEDTNFDDKDIQTVEGNMKAKIKMLCDLFDVSGKASVNITEAKRNELNKFNFEIFGDISPDNMPQTLIEAIKFMKIAPSLIKNANYGKGKAIKYTLIPVSLLRTLWKTNAVANSFVKRIEEETVQRCVELFDNINLIEQKVNDLYSDIKKMEHYIETDHVEKITDLKFNYNLYQARVRRKLSEHLILVRSGNETVNKLEEILIQASKDTYSWKNVHSKLKEFVKLKQEISFIKLMMKMNVKMLDKDTILRQFLLENFNKDVYILFYNYEYSKGGDNATHTFINILENKQDYGPRALFVAVNCLILDEGTNDQFINLKYKPKVSLFRNGKLSIENYEIGDKPNNDTNSNLWSFYHMQQQVTSIQQQVASIIKDLGKKDKHSTWQYALYALTNGSFFLSSSWIYFCSIAKSTRAEDFMADNGMERCQFRVRRIFFRVLGGESAHFGVTQEENCPRVVEVQNSNYDLSGVHEESLLTLSPGVWSYKIWTGQIGSHPKNIFMRFKVSSGEVRPRNKAIRIWKRTD